MSPLSPCAGEAPESPSAGSSLEQEEMEFLRRELAGVFAAQAPLVQAFLDRQPRAGQEAMYKGAARFVLDRARDVGACLKECLDALVLGADAPEGAEPAAPAGPGGASRNASSGQDAAGEAEAGQAEAVLQAEGGAGAGPGPADSDAAAGSGDEAAPAAASGGDRQDEGGAQPASREVASAASEVSGSDGAAPEDRTDSGPADWRGDCRAIAQGRYDADRGKILGLLERAMAKADEEGAGPEDRRLVEAASDHFTALLARGAAGAGAGSGPGPEAEPKKAPESGAATFTVTPSGTCASGGVDIPVVHAGSGTAPGAAGADGGDETPCGELPPCIQELVRLAEGRLDTGDAQADVRSLSQRFRQLREEAIAKDGAGRWDAYFKRASAHIAKLLNRVHGEGGFAREEADAQPGEGSPRYMREVDAVARGEYDGRVDDIYAILSNAILEARRDGREEEFQARLEAASEHLNRLLSSRCVHAGRPAGRDPSQAESAEELKQEIFRDETPDEDFVSEAEGEALEAAPPSREAAGPGHAVPEQGRPPREQASRRQAGEEGAAAKPRGQQGSRVRHAGPARGMHRPPRHPSWQSCVQAVKDIGQGRFDNDPKGALELLREAASRLEQEGLAEHFEPEIRRAARRLALLMRQEPEGASGGRGQPGAHRDPRFGQGAASPFGQRFDPRSDVRFDGRGMLPSYMQGVEDINQGRFDDDPGTMLEILDYAIRAASRQGRLEEFRPRLEQASRRASAVLERRSGGLFGGRFF